MVVYFALIHSGWAFTLTVLSTTSLKLSEADEVVACDMAWSSCVTRMGGWGEQGIVQKRGRKE